MLRRFSYNPAHNRTGLLAFGVLGNICDGLSDRKRKICNGSVVGFSQDDVNRQDDVNHTDCKFDSHKA